MKAEEYEYRIIYEGDTWYHENNKENPLQCDYRINGNIAICRECNREVHKLTINK